jgi:hypothetical protein
MRNARRFATALAVAAMALVGCGSPTSSITFKPPDDWSPSSSIFGMGQIWKSPDTKQMLMLMKLPVAMKVSDAFKTVNLEDTKVEKQQHVTICGNQAAIYIKASGIANINGVRQHSTMDMIMSSTGGATYMALYARPDLTALDDRAETAIRSLCQKQ